eukprot:COSAG04_NODE_223_length_19649_cov_12.486650_9_plen_187_part_00
MGEYDLADYNTQQALALFLMFITVFIIVMLNLLIAIMTECYETSKQEDDIHSNPGAQCRVRWPWIVEEEARMSNKEKRLNEEELFPPFLEVLQPAVVSRPLRPQDTMDKVNALRAEMDSKIGIVESKVDTILQLLQQPEQEDRLAQRPSLRRSPFKRELGPELEPEPEPEPEPVGYAAGSGDGYNW